MNFFSFVLLGLVLFIITRYKNKKAYIYFFSLTLLVYLTTNAGYFINIFGIAIDYYRFLSYLLGAYSGILIFRQGLKKKDFIRIGLLYLCAGVSLFLCYLLKYQITTREVGGWDAYLFGYDNMGNPVFGTTNIKYILDLFFMTFVYLYCKYNFRMKEWNQVIKCVSKYSKIFIMYGIFEFVTVYFFDFISLSRNIVQAIFGTAVSTFDVALKRGSGFMLQGMFREPSQYVRGLMLVILLLASDEIINRNDNKIWIIICITIMCVSMSFTSILLIAFLLGLYVLYKCKINPNLIPITVQIGILLSGLFVVGVVYLVRANTYYGIRINNAIKIVLTLFKTSNLNTLYDKLRNSMKDGSSILRIGSSYANIVLQFMKNPVLGIGIGNSITFSYTSNLLTDLGILGTGLYSKIFIFGRKASVYYVASVILFFCISFFTCITQEFGVDVLFVFLAFDIMYNQHRLVKC